MMSTCGWLLSSSTENGSGPFTSAATSLSGSSVALRMVAFPQGMYPLPVPCG